MRQASLVAVEGGSRLLVALIAAALSVVAGCDLGGRQQLVADAGIDGGGDTDSESDSDTGSEDGGTDDDWRYKDAGAGWDDGGVSIDQPCDNDCSYLYNIVGDEWDESAGMSSFTIEPSGAGKVEARGTDSFRYILWWGSWSNYALYRQRLLTTLTLDSTSHDLISGEAVVYNRVGNISRLKKYEFEYDQWTEQFSCTVDTDGRRWTRTFSVTSPPLVMFNERDFPLEGYGSHSSLFAFLVGERYDWSAGGQQQIAVFSPEIERIEQLTVEQGDDEDTLIVTYPVDTHRPGNEDSPDFDPNSSELKYELGIPVWFDTRMPYHGQVFNGTPFELNLAEVPESTEIAAPTPVGGYSTSDLEVVSGDVTLAGVVDDPDATGPHPVVVMLPGWDHLTRQGEVGAIDLYAQLADQLAAAGYLVVRIDARGTGASDGDLAAALLSDLVDDGEAIAAAVGGLDEADASQIFLLTGGLGAHVAAGVATGGEVTLAGVILLAPIGSDYQESADEIYAHYMTSAGFHVDFVTNTQFETMAVMDALADGEYDGDYFMGHGTSSWQSLLGQDLIAGPPALPPTLILYGGQDHMIPANEASELASALSGASVEVTSTVLDGLSHALTVGTAEDLWPEHGSAEAVDDAAIDALVLWLDGQTGGE
jgi:dienelactone hydrolase